MPSSGTTVCDTTDEHKVPERKTQAATQNVSSIQQSEWFQGDCMNINFELYAATPCPYGTLP
jgi:hypothetical protein